MSEINILNRLTKELKHLQNVFQYRNSSTHWVIKQILEQVYIERKHDLSSKCECLQQ